MVPYLQSLDYAKGRAGREYDDTDVTRACTEIMQKDALIQGLGITVLVASIALAIGLNARGELPLAVALPGGIGTVTALVGMVAGRAIRNRMSLELFRRWVVIGLVALGLAMIARALNNLDPLIMRKILDFKRYTHALFLQFHHERRQGRHTLRGCLAKGPSSPRSIDLRQCQSR